MTSKIYDPADLKSDAYAEFESRMNMIAAKSVDVLDLLLGFKYAWTNEAFSHFQFSCSQATAAQMIEQFDGYRSGKKLAYVNFDEDIAVLTIHTMMGVDTIEYIDTAFDEIAANQPKALIVDLRQNAGGAFAVKPLVEHIIQQPLDGGYFVSQKWNALATAKRLAREAIN